MKSVLSEKHFHSEAAAYKFVEAHVWKDGRCCPHCGVIGRSGALKGKSTRIGVYKCYECRKPFTVKVGTIFESSHIKLHVWLQAIFLMSSSKKGMSANQFARTLGVTLKSAWFLAHRIREAMGDDGGPLGGRGMIVEADETYLGQKEVVTKRTKRGKPSHSSKLSVVSLVERGGKVKSFHVERADKATVAAIVVKNVKRESHLHTDESWLYTGADAHVEEHHKVHHMAGEYVRDNVHNNTVEGYFGVFKRGMRGTYQHCNERHLHRYLNEFDFRYNTREALGHNDEDRAVTLLKGVVGKRLTYETAKTKNAA
jgi:transposase-like protein